MVYLWLCLFFSLIANGDLINPASRLLIPRKALNQWDHVLQMVTEKITLRSGAVHRYVRVIFLQVYGIQNYWGYSHETLETLVPRSEFQVTSLSLCASVSLSVKWAYNYSSLVGLFSSLYFCYFLCCFSHAVMLNFDAVKFSGFHYDH